MTGSKRIFISNRLPFTLDSKSGEVSRGSGGLVSALLGVSLNEPFIWMGFETDAAAAKTLYEKASEQQKNLQMKPVLLEKKLYESYYDAFCNDALWPLFHYEAQHSLFQRSHWNSYVKANQTMADEILKVAKSGDTIWIHDFHFFLLPEMIKDQNPNLKIGFFLHIPFPSSEIFRQLPVREKILRALTKCDLIGFHEHSYLRHFTVSLKAFLGIDSTFFKAEMGDHTLHLGVYPISIDTEAMKLKAGQPEVLEQTEKYRESIRSPFLVLGIDRLDYTKGLELKLRGFRRVLQKYPELRGKINLLQVGIPTRVKVPAYIRLKKQIDQLVGTINGEFASPGYTPVNYIFNSVSEVELLALYRRSECLLVSSKRDGMNLVAMEYAVSQCLETPGVLILSEFAGVASLLGHSLLINPWDEDSIADALYFAWKMPEDERRERLEGHQNTLSKYSASLWASSFLKDLDVFHTSQVKKPVVRLSPHQSEWPEHLQKKIANAGLIHLVLDYDGTLVALQRSPELAVLKDEKIELLKNLSRSFAIDIVSGRSREFLDQQFLFSNNSFGFAAEHGAFFKALGDPNWKSRISSDIESWYSEAEMAMKAYADRVPFSFIEKKAAALVWHYRMSPPDFANFQAKKLDDELQVGLANQPVSVTIGSKIVEAKAIECNKGNFVRWLMEQADKDSFFICIGDDRTDEDMFKVIQELPETRGIAIKVGTEKTMAGFRLHRQDEVQTFLRELHQAREV